MGGFVRGFFYSLFLFLGNLSAQPEAKETEQVESVIILGGGVGALTSSIYLQRAGIDTLVVEGNVPGGAIAQSPMVHNWPSEDGINGQALIEKIRKQALNNGAKIISEEVVSVDFSKRPFQVQARDVMDRNSIRTIKANAAIIAMGSNPRLLGVPGEDTYWTKGVYSCAVCDGSLYKGKIVAVVGGGDSAIIEADYLSNIAKKVHIIIRSDQFRTVEAIRKNNLVRKNNVKVHFNTQIKEIQGDGQKVSSIKTNHGKIDVNGIFLAIGATPNTQIFQDQLKLDSKGYIVLTKDQQTTVEGIYAVGDIVDPVFKQAVSAAGDGAKAALQVEQHLASVIPPKSGGFAPKTTVIQTKNTSNVQELSSAKEFAQLIEDKTPIVFDFYSPFCGPCKQLGPKIDDLSEKYKGKIRFVKINVTEYPKIAESYNIYSVPTVLIFKNERVMDQATGLDEIYNTLKKLDNL